MAESTKIQWTHHTFNPWRGCTKVSPGCANCYAEAMSGRNPAVLGVWGPKGTRVVASEAMWREPLKWNARAALAEQMAAEAKRNPPGGYTVLPYERPRAFCASLADVFEGPETMPAASVVAVEDARLRLFHLIDQTPHLDWLLLTKRPENVLKMTYDAWCRPVPGHVSQNAGDGRRWQWPPNVWIGTSVENQAAADERVPHLLRVPAVVRFLSCEPLLGPVDLSEWLKCEWYGGEEKAANTIPPTTYRPARLRPRVDWVIVGGESGPGARPMRVEWARSLVKQCRAASVPVFVKQLGSFPEDERDPATGNRVLHVRQVLTIRDKKGGDMAEFPPDLRVREFPAA